MSVFQKTWAPIASALGTILLALQLAEAFKGNRTLFTGILILISLIAIGVGMGKYAFAPSVIPPFPRYKYQWAAKTIFVLNAIAIIISATFILTILDVVPDCCGFVPTIGPTPNTPYFYEPTSDGYRIDWCLESATGCGKPAAILWCRSQRFTEVVDFTQDPNVGEREIKTKMLGNGEICDDQVCDSFKSITCK
jgi:hypothetical protein